MQFQLTSAEIIVTLNLILLMLTPVIAPAANDVVTANEMLELLPGNTMSGKNQRTREIHVYHESNGTIEGMIRNGRFYDSGTWEITDNDQYCRKWKKWRDRARHCFRIYRLEPNNYLLKAINYPVDTKFEIREGDPEKLKVN